MFVSDNTSASITMAKSELHDMLMKWYKQVTTSLVAPLWLMNGMLKNEAEARYLKMVNKMGNMGVILGRHEEYWLHRRKVVTMVLYPTIRFCLDRGRGVR